MKKIILLLIFLAAFNCQIVHANQLKEIFALASKAFNDGQHEIAVNLYMQCLKIYPKFSPAYAYIALSSKALGKDEKEVIKLFERAIELDPKSVMSFDNLSRIYYNNGDLDKAEEYALKAVEIDPSYNSAQLSLGWVYLFGKTEPRNSIECFEKSLEGADIPYAYFGLGLAHFLVNERGQAIDMITKLKKSEKKDLAKQLESLMRNKTYVPPSNMVDSMPFAFTSNIRKVSKVKGFSSNFNSENSVREEPVKVRLRSDPREVSNKRIIINSDDDFGQNRIEQLQNRRRKIGEVSSDYELGVIE